MLFDSRVVCLTALLFCGSAIAGESNWQVLLWSEPVVVSVDTSSIVSTTAPTNGRTSSRTTARVLWDYAEVQHTFASPPALFRSMIGVLVFDCPNELFGGASGLSFSGEAGTGDLVSRYAISPEEAPLAYPAAGTIAHDLLAFVCRYSK